LIYQEHSMLVNNNKTIIHAKTFLNPTCISS